MRDILIFAELTFREARRSKILWTALGLGIAFIALYGLGFYYIHQDITRYNHERDIALDASFNFVVMAGLYVINFLGVMLAVLTSVGAISGEIASHTIQALATKPVRRVAILLGKWLGLALMLTTYILLLAGGIVIVTWAISNYLLPNALAGILLIALQALIILSLSILGSTRLSTIANGVLVFMCYGLAFIGGWIEQMGALMHNETAVDIGILTSLLVPSEAIWKMAANIMQPPAINALGLSPFSMAVAPSIAMLIYALVYMIALIALAIYSFNHRDL